VDNICDSAAVQIYSRGPRGPPSEPELVEQLVSMGFERNQSAAALRRFRNMDMALAYLLRAAEDGGDAEQQQQRAASEGAERPGAVMQQQQQQGQAAPVSGSVTGGQAGGAAGAVAERGSAAALAARGGPGGGPGLDGPPELTTSDEDEDMSPGEDMRNGL
jgi:hypothetical protein